MVRFIGDHPLIFGAATSLIFASVVWSEIFGAFGPTRVRGLGLIIFGAAAALLYGATRESAAIFWFFLGGAISVTLLFLVSLALIR